MDGGLVLLGHFCCQLGRSVTKGRVPLAVSATDGPSLVGGNRQQSGEQRAGVPGGCFVLEKLLRPRGEKWFAVLPGLPVEQRSADFLWGSES